MLRLWLILNGRKIRMKDYQHAKKIFQLAVEIVPEKRADFLDEVCQDDPDLRREVERLLDSGSTEFSPSSTASQPEAFTENDTEDAPTKVFPDSEVFEAPTYIKKTHSQIAEKNKLDFEDTDALVGQILDNRFLIKKDLTEKGAHKGGFGLVYLAEDMKLLGKETVVKILKRTSLSKEDGDRKFLHEEEALIRLDHPNIVRILDVGALSDGNPFMVMEYIPGYSLRRLLNEQGKLPIDFCIHIIKKVTDALSSAHVEKILHRDIKPENIMLTPQIGGFDRVRLIDFGIARVEESKLAPETIIQRGIGTILYMPPEQLIGKLEQTPAMDIYAFAIVIYEMLTGKKPFSPRSSADMYRLQRDGHQEISDELKGKLPETAVRLLLSALEFDPLKRPQNARQFGLELASALKNEEPGANVATAALKPFGTSTDDSFQIKETGKTPFKLAGLRHVFLLLLVVTVGVAGFLYWQAYSFQTALQAEKDATGLNAENTENSSILPEREFPFYLMVQKYRGGQPYKEPFRSTGREIFETGYKFQMVFETVPEGFFYIFNEDSNARTADGAFNILFPTPLRNEGLAQVREGQKIETGNNRFGSNTGKEFVWIIWTKERQPALEDVRETAFANQGAVSQNEKTAQLREFINRHFDPETKVIKQLEEQKTVIKRKGDFLVYKIELEHK